MYPRSGHDVYGDRYSDLYQFKTATNQWCRLPDGPMEGRGGPGVFAVDRSIWVAAGFCGRPMSDVWEYKTGPGAWQEHRKLSLPHARSIFASAPVGTAW